MPMDYVVTAVAPHEARDGLLELWCQNFSGEWDDWYEWMCERNPFGPVSNWMVETEGGHVVGSTGLMLRRMKLFNRVRQIGQAIHLNVDRQHRTALPATKLQRALTASVADSDAALVCGVTDTAVGILRRTGYKLLGDVERWIKPLRSEYKLKDRFRNRLIRRTAAAAVDFGLKLRSAETFARRPRGVTADDGPVFDDRFDRLWESAAPRFPILGDRSRTFLDWRFCQRPKTDCRVFTISDARGELAGYIVYSTDDPNDDADYVQIHDLLYSEPSRLCDLLAAFCRHIRKTTRADAISMNYLGQPDVTRELERFGFFERGGKLKVLIYPNPAETDLDVRAVLDSTQWHLTDAELDF